MLGGIISHQQADRERHVNELARHFDTLASRPDARRGLEIFYVALRDLDTDVPYDPLIIGRRVVYEEDLVAVRRNARELDAQQLDRLLDSVRRVLDAGSPAGTSLRI